jgi:hypothetical protein
MDSDEKRICGGAGGGPVAPHDDQRFVNGSFERAAHHILMLTTPGEDRSSLVSVVAAGDGARVKVHAEKTVVVRTGDAAGSNPIPDDVGLSGVTVYAPGAAILQLQRGDFDQPECQTIKLDSDGSIFVNAGVSGNIYLGAGPVTADGQASSFIYISPTGITIKGPLIQIN